MISTSYFWMNISILAVGTFAIRFSMIALSSKMRISQRTKQIFTFVPVCVLPAFIAPAVFYHQGQIPWLFEKERLAVLVFATFVCFLTRSILLTICFGLGVLAVLLAWNPGAY